MLGWPLRPMWAEMTLGAIGCGAILGSVLLMNAYPLPRGILRQHLMPFQGGKKFDEYVD